MPDTETAPSTEGSGGLSHCTLFSSDPSLLSGLRATLYGGFGSPLPRFFLPGELCMARQT